MSKCASRSNPTKGVSRSEASPHRGLEAATESVIRYDVKLQGLPAVAVKRSATRTQKVPLQSADSRGHSLGRSRAQRVAGRSLGARLSANVLIPVRYMTYLGGIDGFDPDSEG